MKIYLWNTRNMPRYKHLNDNQQLEHFYDWDVEKEFEVLSFALTNTMLLDL